MVMVVKPKSKVENIIVADGSYPAILSKITTFSNAYGQRLGFEFTLNDGHKIMRSTNTVLSEKSKLVEVVAGLSGKQLTCNDLIEGIDLDSLIGTECNVLIVNSTGKNGVVYSNVERVFQA